MARRKIIPNGTIMRWRFNRNVDAHISVRVLQKVKREKGQWQKYHVQRLDNNKTHIVQGNALYDPIPKFNTLEEVEAWLESQQ